MFRILWQEVFTWTESGVESTWLGRVIYTVPTDKCTLVTIYVTLAQWTWQSANQTTETVARYKLHINKAGTTGTSDEFGNIPPVAIWPTFATGSEAGTLSYYPKRENESMPDVYSWITLNYDSGIWAGDQIVFYAMEWRMVVQVFWLELPNDIDMQLYTWLKNWNTDIHAPLHAVVDKVKLEMVDNWWFENASDLLAEAKQQFVTEHWFDDIQRTFDAQDAQFWSVNWFQYMKEFFETRRNFTQPL